jgi:hypothetical protein
MFYIKGAQARHTYSLVSGIMTVYFLYRHDMWGVIVLHVIIHQLILRLKDKSGLYASIGMFSFLSGYHIWRMYVAYGSYVQDFTLILMNHTIKVTYLAFAVYDYYIKENVETMLKLKNYVTQKKGNSNAFEIKSVTDDVHKALETASKELKVTLQVLEEELKKIKISPEILEENLIQYFPKVARRNTAQMDEKSKAKTLADEKKKQDTILRTISHLPGFLEYMSYNFTFIGFCCPFTDYRDYSDFIYQRENYANIQPIPKKKLWPEFGNLLFYALAFILLTPLFPITLIISDEWLDCGMLYK